MKRQSSDARTFWVLERKQLLCLASARRTDIIDKLAAMGPLSIRELGPLMGASPVSLYHHMDKLLRVGLVVKAGHRIVRRKREQIYATPAPRMRLLRALGDPANRRVMSKIVKALLRQMDRDFGAGLGARSARAAGADRNLGFFRLIGAPSPKQLAAINRRLYEIAEILWASAGNTGALINLGWTMAPVVERKTDLPD